MTQLLSVRRLSTLDEFEALQSDWAAIDAGIPLRSHAWLESWWKHYQSQFETNGELCVLVVENEQGELQGAAPLFLERSATQGGVLKLLGSGEVCTDFLSLLSREGLEAAVAVAVTTWLTENVEEWDLLELEAIPTEDIGVRCLTEALQVAGHSAQPRKGDNCWRIEMPPTWDDYLASLSKSHRKQLRRADKRMLQTERVTFHTVSEPNELERAFDILVELHQLRRNSIGEPGCFASERFEAFLREAASRLLSTGQLDLHYLEIDGVPVTAEIHFTSDDVIYCYQSGVHPDYLDDEPGRLLTIAVMQRACEQGKFGIDLMRGDEPYKAHWRAEPSPLQNWRITPNKTSAQLRQSVWAAGDTMKSWVKTGLGLAGLRE